jgi:TPP-dependent pyruvate/acetoin dehydrogenase alpha subunit
MGTKTKELAVATPNSTHPNPLMSHEKLRQLYSTMLKCRLLDERTRILEKQANFEDHYTASVGQEATAVGAAIDLRPEDTVAPAHRDSILNFVKGVPLTVLFSQIYGRSTSPVSVRSGSGHSGYAPLNIILPVPNIATPLNISTGIALANQTKNNDNVVVAFSGQGSASLRTWCEVLNLAGRRSLPIVFVSRSNLLAESVPVKPERELDEISPMAAGYGFPAIPVDGNDAVAVYRVAQEAIERARSGGGPTLIETLTIRGQERTENGSAKHRAWDEVDEWKSRDPVAKMEHYLTGKGLFSKGWKKDITDAFQQELDTAIKVAGNNRFASA